MKKFVFNLQSLLTLRDLEEQNARTALSEANAQIDRIDDRIGELKESIESAYSSWDGSSGRTFSKMDRMGVVAQVASLESEAAGARTQMQQAESARASAMAKLVEASKRRKVITNLKDKRQREYDVEMLKREAAEIEDIFNARRREV